MHRNYNKDAREKSEKILVSVVIIYMCYVMHIHTPPSLIWMFSAKPRTGTIEEGTIERQVKVRIKIWKAGKQFLPISSQIQLLEYFPRKQKEQKHKQLGYTDKLVTTQI
jgi:hypothetical protein